MDEQHKTELKNTFNRLRTSSFDGVEGVMCMNGSQPGPVVGVTVCTHGNEPSGLYAVQYLLSKLEDGLEISAGSVCIVLNNVKATEAYFNAQTEKEKANTRYIDMNLNRLPDDAMALDDSKYEIKRAKELKLIWDTFTYALDIHSTTLESEPFIVDPHGDVPVAIFEGFPIYKIISGIENFTKGNAAVNFYGGNHPESYPLGIECGSHENNASFNIAAQSLLVFLQNTGCIKKIGSYDDVEYQNYEIAQSVYYPDQSYAPTKLFKNFEFVPKGTILAKGKGQDIVAEKDSHTFFAKPLDHIDITEEVMFLSKPFTTLEAKT